MENVNITTETKSPQTQVQQANGSVGSNPFEAQYLKKDYKGAVSYLLQNKQLFDSGIFHYNLGTVYSKMGDYPAARFHLEKAIKEGYINSSSLNNQNFVRNQLDVDDLSTSSNLPDQMINIALSVPSEAYLSLTLLFLLGGVLLLKAKKLVKKTSIFFALILTLAPVAFSNLYLDKINSAIAFKDLPLYEGPSKIFAEKGKIKAGSKIILGEFKDGWFYVKFPISLTGWISKDQLGLY
jgi:hypothetical protein